MTDLSDLTDDLRALGRAAQPDLAADVFATRVVAALPAPAVAARPRVRLRVALAALAVLAALVATPPVRATVADWFGFGAVRVEPGREGPSGEPAVPEVEGGQSVEAAAGRVDFPVYVPAALGAPDGVEVSGDRRRVSMSWGSGDGTVRVDQLAGTLDYAMVKQAPRLQFVTVDGRDVLWFPVGHRVAMLDPSGDPAGAFRVADHTLVVPLAGSTLRVEGPLTLDDATELARSLRAVG